MNRREVLLDFIFSKKIKIKHGVTTIEYEKENMDCQDQILFLWYN